MMARIQSALRERWSYWHPSVADQRKTAGLLAEFYRTRSDYHAMTAKPEKRGHPQVRLLLEKIAPSDICVEFGCGGGVVLEAVAEKAARVIGMDVAPLGLQKTTSRTSAVGSAFAIQCDVARAPLRSEIADVVYSLEVLEHVWNPDSVLAEMVRVLKPGGLLFVTTPNGFSLDLHLQLRAPVRAVNLAGAVSAYIRDSFSGSIFRNTEPDLNTVPSYSDCDMITKIFPRGLELWLRNRGCDVEMLETYFFQKAKAPHAAALRRFEELERHPFYRYFGDHILALARKRPQISEPRQSGNGPRAI
jgi:2-polyprenyl-3-methyl-5-hydroxy-6-metoxy-1,4-benzoquinol methylase